MALPHEYNTRHQRPSAPSRGLVCCPRRRTSQWQPKCRSGGPPSAPPTIAPLALKCWPLPTQTRAHAVLDYLSLLGWPHWRLTAPPSTPLNKQAMLNYLSLLGWNDGSEQEIYSVDELQTAFSLERITKSAAGACC